MRLSRFARSRSRTRGSSGQSLVETALILPVFFLILFGLIDGGRFVYTDSVMSEAAREGARLAAVEAAWIGKAATDPSCVLLPSGVNPAVNPGAHVCPANTANLVTNVAGAANRMVAGVGTIATIDVRCDAAGTILAATWAAAPATCNGIKSGDIVSVRVTYLYRPLAPIAGQIIGSVNRSASTSMTIN
jgi:hypothetical protein